MRLRWMPAAAVAAITLAGLPAHAAASTVTFTDPAGDWAVAAQDIVKVSLQSASHGAERVVSIDITLAAPVGTAYTIYAVGFRSGSLCYGLTGETASGQAAGYSAGGVSSVPADLSVVRCAGDATQQATTAPATMTVHGATVHIGAAYALGLRPGLRLSDIGAAVGTEPTQSAVFVGSKGVTPQSGDFASTRSQLTLR